MTDFRLPHCQPEWLRTLSGCLLWLTCCCPAAAQPIAQESLYELTFPAMGTLLAFQSYTQDQQMVDRAFRAAEREVERLNDILTDYSTESETVLLTSAEKIGQWQTVSPELWEVLVVCDQWHQHSAGAFDASVGQLSRLWRKARKSQSLPTAQDIQSALALCGWKHVHLDHPAKRVMVDLPGLRFDFGAMGKGYVIDKAFEVLVKEGLPCSLVRAGGDLRVGTAPPNKPGWPIEIAKLDGEKGDQPEPFRLYLSNAAVSSSGDLYQYLEVEGVRRSHVLDPRTGWGVVGPRLVTVIAANSTLADAADTAMCAMSDAAALSLAEKIGNLQVRLVTVNPAPLGTQVRSTPQFGMDQR